jgi:aminobenzoyl-glutamate utilization protein B
VDGRKQRPRTIAVYGTPAEEGGGGKSYMVSAGLFKDVDVTVYWHPADANNAVAGQEPRQYQRQIPLPRQRRRMRRPRPSAALCPRRGRGDERHGQLYARACATRRAHSLRHHNGGAAPNIVPEFSESYYMVRHPDPRVVADVFERIKKAAEGAALGTGTKMDFELIGGDYSILPNDTLGKIMDAQFAQSRCAAVDRGRKELGRESCRDTWTPTCRRSPRRSKSALSHQWTEIRFHRSPAM